MSTGLWAPAGAAITVQIDASSPNFAIAKANLGVQIGSHKGNLFVCRTIFCRPPYGVITRKWFGNLPHDGGSLPGTDTLLVANSWGGLIYILVPKVCCSLTGFEVSCACQPFRTLYRIQMNRSMQSTHSALRSDQRASMPCTVIPH